MSYFEQKDIPDTDGWYQATTDGRIWSCRTGKFLKQHKNKNGYMYCGLGYPFENQPYLVHRLVAQTWIDNPEHKKYVDHINENRSDNRIENLRWLTHSENLHNSSKTKGYSFDKRNHKYRVEIMLNRVKTSYGYFDTEEEARAKYLEVKENLINIDATRKTTINRVHEETQGTRRKENGHAK